MPDEMFLSKDSRTLIKGKRRDRRTQIKRLVEFRAGTDSGKVHRGIVLDLNAYSMRIRSLLRLPVGTPVSVDMKWSAAIPGPSKPLRGTVKRVARVDEGQFDLGVQLQVPDIHVTQKVLRDTPLRKNVRAWPPTRMHVVDFVVGRR